MKKKMFGVLAIVCCLLLVGCKKNGNNSGSEVGDITLNNEVKGITIPWGATEIFYKAANKIEDNNYEPLVLLGTQIVSGTNYMYLCKEVNDGGFNYKVIIVYNDLNGNSTIISTKDFDVLKYFNKNIDGNRELLDGGWEVVDEFLSYDMSESLYKNFKKIATNFSEYGILLATQVNNGTNYGILALGKDKTIKFVTMNVTSKNKASIVSTAYVELSDFN